MTPSESLPAKAAAAPPPAPVGESPLHSLVLSSLNHFSSAIDDHEERLAGIALADDVRGGRMAGLGQPCRDVLQSGE